MKFILDIASKNSNSGGRLGHLIADNNGKLLKIPTPTLFLTTKCGSIPYLTREVFNYLSSEKNVLQVSLSTTEHMEEALKVYKKNFSQYIGFDEYPIYVTINDPCELVPSGFNEKELVSLWTRRGKQSISPERFMKLMEIIKPNIYHTLCDSDTNAESSKKRIQKSVDRTELFFKACLDIHKTSPALSNSLLLAPIVGGFSNYARSSSIKTALASSEIGGFVFEGFHNYGESALTVNLESIKDCLKKCMEEINNNNNFRIMQGSYNPLILLETIKLGIDCFDTSYVYIASQSFKALIFNFDLNNPKENNEFCIDLTDQKYKEDFSPLLTNCSCLACQKHTKAYLYHLVQTKELLGPILLMIHNTHHYMKFFEIIRKAIAEDKLDDLIVLMKTQVNNTKDEFLISGKNSSVSTVATNLKEVKKRIETETDKNIKQLPTVITTETSC